MCLCVCAPALLNALSPLGSVWLTDERRKYMCLVCWACQSNSGLSLWYPIFSLLSLYFSFSCWQCFMSGCYQCCLQWRRMFLSSLTILFFLFDFNPSHAALVKSFLLICYKICYWFVTTHWFLSSFPTSSQDTCDINVVYYYFLRVTYVLMFRIIKNQTLFFFLFLCSC